MCYCVVLKCVGVVIILTMHAPLTVGSSPGLCSCVVDRSAYVDINATGCCSCPFVHFGEVYSPIPSHRTFPTCNFRTHDKSEVMTLMH
jgi:hypothetical protein